MSQADMRRAVDLTGIGEKHEGPQPADPQPVIKHIDVVTLQSPQGVAFVTFGLGEDNKIYQWHGDKQAWVNA